MWNDSDGEPLALVFAQEHGAGLEAWQTRTRCETLTPLILVRIQVPQPQNLPIPLRFVSFLLRRNSSDMSAGYAPSITMVRFQRRKTAA